MVLWIDEFRPKTLNTLDLHPEITERLRRLATGGDIPHMLFFGPAGSGKHTRINALLRAIYGPSVDKVRAIQRNVETKSKTVEIPCLTSSYHIEINPSDAGNADTYVIQDVIKEIAMTQSVAVISRGTIANNTTNSKDKDSMSDDVVPSHVPPSFKIVVLHEVDKLSADAQHGLRRTMEQYSKTCRLILCAESSCRIISPLKSRCLLLRVPSPTDASVITVMRNVLQSVQAQANAIDENVLIRIAQQVNGDLGRALAMLETAFTCNNGNLTAQSVVKVPEWITYIEEITRNIIKDQSPAQLLVVRGQLYQILSKCIPADIILQHLAKNLAQYVDDMTFHQVIRWRAFYDHRLATGNKDIYHLEAFVAKIMVLIRSTKLKNI